MSSFRRSVRHLRAFPQRLLTQAMQRILRSLLHLQGQRQRLARAGFVFPTTVLLLLIVTLTTTALISQAARRSDQAILERQQQVVVNAGSPAIDRAKAKIEYLFGKDTRSPRKVPTSDQLATMLKATIADPNLEITAEPNDIYTLPEESRLDLDGNGTADNAWMFNADVNGDGTVGDNEVIIYSILMDDEAGTGADKVVIEDKVDFDKAKALVTRNGPISTAEVRSTCPGAEDAGQRSEEGWQIVNQLNIQKNFQVDVFAADLTNFTGTVSTLEFQQVREAARSNKWGAWFRYDLEVFPGPDFNWNGAMHTQGSFFASNRFRGYMVSSTRSCIYDKAASEITLGIPQEGDDPDFQGQLVNGFTEVYGNQPSLGSPKMHVDNGSATPDDRTLSGTNDSVTPTGTSPLDIFLDPIKVYLQDRSEHINRTTWSRNAGFPTSTNLNGRVRNVGEGELRNISLDDIFRADNRWGPKAVYDKSDPVNGQIPSGVNIGTDIPASNTKLVGDDAGLDGYWERRAIKQGARIIVGERLELGNANGWNYDPTTDAVVANSDPLYPPTALAADTSATGKYGLAEQKQRKALRDNLAAVQGTVVYHYTNGNGLSPVACVATTAHFGTYKAIADSRTFRKIGTAGSAVMTDFLTGKGTNGWEFAPVTTPNANAMGNLAKFAGDVSGGAPTFQPVQDTNIHPYPYLSMWGDFSTLRRVQASGNGSPADRSAEDTAACTLGLLAYNLKAIKDEYNAVTAAEWQALATDLKTNYDNSLGLEDGDYKAWQAIASTPALQQRIDIGWHYWAVERDRTLGFTTGKGLPATTGTPVFAGSATGTYAPNAGTFTITSPGSIPLTKFAASTAYNVGCDPKTFTSNTGTTADYGVTNIEDALALALAICSKQVYYPALFYLFPTASPNLSSRNPTSIPIPIKTAAADSYGGEDGYGGVSTAAITYSSLNTTEDYAVRAQSYNAATFATFSNYSDIMDVAATPRVPGSWDLPSAAASGTVGLVPTWGNANEPEAHPWRVAVQDGTSFSNFDVGILDKVVQNGRENMPMRVLDLDINALTTKTINSMEWLPGKDANNIEHYGLVYAFREDAVREDEIVRPAASGATSATCNTFATFRTYSSANNGCYMNINADSLTSTDPPLATHRISAKPVDFIPDPDRRPHGFRLRNGADFNRGTDEQSGITFISDNAIVIYGDFNRHTSTVPLEEFSDADKQIFQLPPGDANFFDKFYDRVTLNLANFANSTQDKWRPAEILGDAVYIMSNTERDGFVEAAYAANAGGATGTPFQYGTTAPAGLVSFQNMNRIGNTTVNSKTVPNADQIRREDGSVTSDSPIYFDRNGVVYNASGAALVDGTNYIYWGLGNIEGTGNGNLQQMREDNLAQATQTTVNALLISGIVPSRDNQTYGGLHNFPRLNEFWGGTNLKIAGGFFQLFFSHTSTAPFNMSTWERNDTTSGTKSNIGFYNPPNRVWGYDVALQYSPQPPIASRFISVGEPRSEFYRELPVDDPYIRLLRCAKPVGGQPIDPTATCS